MTTNTDPHSTSLLTSKSTDSLSSHPTISHPIPPILNSITHSLPKPVVDTRSCSLLGPFALAVQTLMGAIILGSLLLKRHRETPKRKYRIWFADVSKQVIGQVFVHILNILISASIASLPSQGNPCAVYFMNIFIDTTIGVFILYLTLNLITNLVSDLLGSSASNLGLSSGHYPSPFLISWLKQLGIYLLSLCILKITVLGMFWLGGDTLLRFGDMIINTISSDGNIQVVVVMMIGPTCLNVMQFLITDSFLKHRPRPQPEIMMRRIEHVQPTTESEHYTNILSDPIDDEASEPDLDTSDPLTRPLKPTKHHHLRVPSLG